MVGGKGVAVGCRETGLGTGKRKEKLNRNVGHEGLYG